MQSTASYNLHEKGLISKEHIVTHTHLNFDHHYSSTLHIKFCNNGKKLLKAKIISATL